MEFEPEYASALSILAEYPELDEEKRQKLIKDIRKMRPKTASKAEPNKGLGSSRSSSRKDRRKSAK